MFNEHKPSDKFNTDISVVETSEKTKKPEKPKKKLVTELLSLKISIDEIKKKKINR